MARLSLRLLGGFQLRRGSRSLPVSARKAQALLAYLALRPGRPQAREALTALLWGDTGDKRARQSLRQTVFRLRGTFAAAKNPGFVVQGETVTFNPTSVNVDVSTFERLVCKGTRHALEAAVELYQGSLLEGLTVAESPYGEWLQSQRERLRELALEALAKVLELQMKSGPVEAAIQTGGRLLALDPLHERTHRILMRLYVRHGRRGAALRQYQTCVGVLQHELGVDPEPETQRLYRDILQREFAAPSGSRPRAVADTPLVGREAELGAVSQALRQVCRGSGRVVLVSGEAGVGKSRLVEELAATAVQAGVRPLLGRAYESAQILPFRPWIDALRGGSVVSHQALRDFDRPWRLELARLFPELSGPEAPPSLTHENPTRLFEAVDRLVTHLALRQPLVLIVEDLHWADEMTLRLFAFVGQQLAQRPILLVGTAREEDLPGTPSVRRVLEELTRDGHLDRLILSPLSRSGTRTLVSALARRGSAPARVATLSEQVWTLSEGNPFVIVETVRALLDGQLPDTATLSLPERVHEVIAARVDRLSPSARLLAKVAAVIERGCTFLLLERASGLSRHDTAECLEELVRRRVFVVGDERFEFTHAYVRSVVHDSLLPPQQHVIHAAVGAALETLYGDRLEQVSDRLAFHFSRADEAPKAFHYLLLLADKTARSYAFEETVTLLRDALAYTHRLPSDTRDRNRLDAMFRLAHVLLLLARPREALELLLAERQRCSDLRDPSVTGLHAFWVAYAYDNLGNVEQGILHAEHALEEAARGGADATMGKANFVLARESHHAGRPRQGITQGRQAVALLERTPERWWLGQAHLWLALNLDHFGDFTSALDALACAREVGEELHDTRLQASAAWTTGWIHAKRGECNTGIAIGERAVELARDPIARTSALGLIGATYHESKDSVRAIQSLEAAIQVLEQLGPGGYKQGHLRAFLTAILSEAHLMEGRHETARDLATTALKVARDSQWPLAAGYAERAQGRIAVTTGAVDDGVVSLRRALATFTSIEARYQVARTHIALAEATGRNNRGPAAMHARKARELFHLLRIPIWVQHSEELERDFDGAAGAP